MPANNKPHKIVITGGPGSGKTSVVEALEADGYTCFHEIIRSFTHKAKKGMASAANQNNPIAFVDDSLGFNRKLLEGRLKQYRKSEKVKADLVFFDRGMPDVLAYMEYFKQDYPDNFKQTCLQHRYDRIIILPPWKEIYNTDGERFENWDVAFEIYHYLKNTYTKLGYEVDEIPKGSIADRKEYIEHLVKPGN